MLSGAGEWVAQVGDWEKHNLILQDLIDRPWPVRYSDGSYLCYYLAFYVVPALAGKLAGIRAASLVCFGWTAAGLWISFAWLYLLGGRKSWLPVCFLLSGNLLWLARFPQGVLALWKGQGLADAWRGTVHFLNASLPEGSIPLHYDSAASALLWVPQHQLGIWVAMGVWGGAWTGQFSRQWALPVAAVLPFWSTVAGLGFLPWLLVLFCRKPAIRKEEVLTLLAFLPGVVVAGSYFLGHMPLDTSGFLYAGIPPGRGLVFLFLTWGVYYLFVRKGPSLSFYSPALLGLTGLFLLAGSSWYLSPANDFGNRFVLATLWVVWLGSWQFAFSGRKGRVWMWCLLLLSSQYAVKILLLVPGGYYQRVSRVPSSTLGEIRTRWPDMARYTPGGSEAVARQYLGRPDSFFNRYLLPPETKK